MHVVKRQKNMGGRELKGEQAGADTWTPVVSPPRVCEAEKRECKKKAASIVQRRHGMPKWAVVCGVWCKR